MTQAAQPLADRPGQVCPHCSTELAPDALSCPACRALVHATTLKALAVRAEEASAAGVLADARQAWQESLPLLPPDSQQYEVIARRIASLEERLSAETPTARSSAAEPGANRQGIAAALAGIGLLLAGKLKFLIIGLTKVKTFVSMFAFFGVYWSTFGWPLALGLVISIYVHEMGHVAALRRLNIAASAPLFIPGLGALVLLKQHIHDPRADAAVGLAGPIWGLCAGLVAYAVYGVTGAMIWVAIAQLTGWINLFNLIPFWQLDGARGFHALTTRQRLLTMGALAAAFLLTGQKLLLLVGAVAVWQTFRSKPGPGDHRALATFVGLIAVLSWMSGLDAV